MRIYNGTGHTLNIIEGAEKNDRDVYVGGREVQRIYANHALKCDWVYRMKFRILDIPVYEKQIISCDTLPAGYDVYIVTKVYADTYTKLFGPEPRLYVAADRVLTADMKLRGITGITRY